MKPAALLCKVALAAVFFWAGFKKATASEIFAIAISEYAILSPEFVRPAARLLPWIELLGAVLVLVPATERAGAALLALLLAVFMTAIGWGLARGIIIECSCFGGDAVPSRLKMWLALGRDAILLAAAVFVILRPSR